MCKANIRSVKLFILFFLLSDGISSVYFWLLAYFILKDYFDFYNMTVVL